MTAAQRPMPATQSPYTADTRLPVRLKGRFLNAQSEEYPMVSLAMSCRTAQVRANHIPGVDTAIVCYFDELGRIVGTVSRHVKGGFIVEFSTTQFKRDKIADRLIWLMNREPLGLTDERKAPRYVAGGPAQVMLKNGTTLNCRVVDFSLTGAGFEAMGPAPNIGDVIIAGDLRGEVVRRDGRAFGIRFLMGSPGKAP